MSGGRLGNALAVVAPCGPDDFLGQHAGLQQVLKIGQTTPDFECTDRRVVFVLDPAVSAQALAERGPAILGRRPKSLVNLVGCGFNLD